MSPEEKKRVVSTDQQQLKAWSANALPKASPTLRRMMKESTLPTSGAKRGIPDGSISRLNFLDYNYNMHLIRNQALRWSVRQTRDIFKSKPDSKKTPSASHPQ
jgi:hypothetical protein